MHSNSQHSTPEVPITTAKDWILTIPFLVAFCSTLVIGDIIHRFLWSKRVIYRFAVTVNKLLVFSMRLSGSRVNIEELKGIPAGTPLIIVSNHQSLMDIPLLYVLFRLHHPKFVSKRELARFLPFVSYHLRHGGHVIIDRKDKRGAVTVLQERGKRMSAEQCSIVLFPEGTRARTGQLGSFKSGGLVTLLEAAPEFTIVPAVIDGSWRFASHKLRPVPRHTTITVKALTPILPENRGETSALLSRIEAAIQGELLKIRGANGEQ